MRKGSVEAFFPPFSSFLRRPIFPPNSGASPFLTLPSAPMSGRIPPSKFLVPLPSFYVDNR